MAGPDIRVGRSLDDVGDEFVAAWKATDAGEAARPVDHLTFVDWTALCAVLTPKRFDLIRQLRREPAPGVRALAQTLGRNEKNVHADIVALSELGLIAQATDGALSAPFDKISSTILFAA